MAKTVPISRLGKPIKSVQTHPREILQSQTTIRFEGAFHFDLVMKSYVEYVGLLSNVFSSLIVSSERFLKQATLYRSKCLDGGTLCRPHQSVICGLLFQSALDNMGQTAVWSSTSSYTDTCTSIRSDM